MHTIDWENTDVTQIYSEEDLNTSTLLGFGSFVGKKEYIWELQTKWYFFDIFPYSLTA